MKVWVRVMREFGAASLALFVLVALVSSPAWSQDRVLMQVICGGAVLTEGEWDGPLKDYEDFVELGSFHHGLSNSSTLDAIGGGGAGKSAPDSFRVVKPVSRSSIGLIESSIRGDWCDSARVIRLRIDPDSGLPEPLWQVDLTQVLVKERREWHTADGPAQESISLIPAQIEWTHFDAEGGQAIFGWDFMANQEP